MEDLIPILALLAALSFLLKIGFYPRYCTLAAALGCSAFVWFVTPWLTDMSKTAVTELVTSRPLLLNLSVCAVIEAVIMIAFCFNSFSADSSRHKTFSKVTTLCLKAYPGLLVGGAIGYAVMISLFAFPGIDFDTLSLIAAVATFPIIYCGAWLLRRLFGRESTRMEMLFLTNLFIVILCIIATGY